MISIVDQNADGYQALEGKFVIQYAPGEHALPYLRHCYKIVSGKSKQVQVTPVFDAPEKQFLRSHTLALVCDTMEELETVRTIYTSAYEAIRKINDDSKTQITNLVNQTRTVPTVKPRTRSRT